MKAHFGFSFAKRSLVIAATALPSLYASLASAQAAAPAPPPAAPPAAVAPAPPPPPAAPVAAPPPEAAAAPAPAVVTPPAPDVPPAPPAVPAPDPDAEKYKHINMGIWMRVDATLNNPSSPKKLNEIGSTGEVELHFSNQMRKYMQWTANFVATYGAADGDGSGNASILDLIAQFEPDPAFNVWVGRMLVPSDRSNFSGPYFMGPWHYPGLGGPKEGPFGRNNGATAWGQFAGGLFKYYLGVFKLNDPAAKPLVSGRLNLSLLSPEPGFYNSSTYYGKDILALGVGFQYQKHGDAGAAGPPATPAADYSLFNADLLFEKDLKESGVVDVEGAFYKYFGDNESQKFSHFVLASYLTPEVAGIGKFQPLVRVQQSKPKTGDTTTVIDGQVGYVVDSYSTRFALGFTHVIADGASASNAVFAGVQLQK